MSWEELQAGMPSNFLTTEDLPDVNRLPHAHLL
jgi:hypothetical protein